MALGRKAIGKTFLGSTENFVSQGVPPIYDLDFSYYLGVPFFHFMSNWETTPHGQNNFTKRGGGPAKVGDRVESWKNTHLTLGEGDAVVAKDHNGENFFGDLGYPTLVEKYYGGKKLRGLRFTGTEYLQIDGATVSDAYSLPAPMFSTSGSPWAGNTGATFIFVIDADTHLGTPPCAGDSYGRCAGDIQTLLYSRQPVLISTDPTWFFPAGYTWPQTEDFGVQYLRNSRANTSPWPAATMQTWGPDGVVTLGINTQLGNTLDRPLINGWGSASFWGVEWTSGPGVSLPNHYANEGFQVIVIEYDNTDWIKWTCLPFLTCTPAGLERDYEGPSFKLYATTPTWQQEAWGSSTVPWPSGDFTIPKLTGAYPALRDHVLFDKKNLFLGGTPPVVALNAFDLVLPYGNGFRGIIYEVLMLEGILSPSDKTRLEKILQRKYPFQ